MADVSGILAAGNIGRTADADPLKQMSTVQGIINSQMQNRLYQQQLVNAQQDLQNKQQALANSQLENQSGQYKLNDAMQTRANAVLFSLSNRSDAELAGGAPLYDAIDREQKSGMLRPEMAAALKQQIDQVTQSGGAQNGAAYRPLLNALFSRNMPTAEAVSFNIGQQRETTTPDGQTQIVQTPGIGAAPGTPTKTVGTPFGGGLSASEGSQLVDYRDPASGRIIQVTKKQLWDSQHGGPAIGGVSAGGAGGGASAGAPRQDEIDTAAHSRNQQQADVQNISSRNFSDMQGSLNSIIKLSRSGVPSGPGTDTMTNVRQILSNTMPGTAKFLFGEGVTAQSMNQQDMWKALSRAALASGSRSDADLFASQASNPNAKMSPEAMQRAAAYVLGLNNQEVVLTREAANNSTNEPKDLGTHYVTQRMQTQDKTDPNAFRFPYMDDAERAKYRASLVTQDQKDRFANTIQLMKKWLPPTASMTPAQ